MRPLFQALTLTFLIATLPTRSIAGIPTPVFVALSYAGNKTGCAIHAPDLSNKLSNAYASWLKEQTDEIQKVSVEFERQHGQKREDLLQSLAAMPKEEQATVQREAVIACQQLADSLDFATTKSPRLPGAETALAAWQSFVGGLAVSDWKRSRQFIVGDFRMEFDRVVEESSKEQVNAFAKMHSDFELKEDIVESEMVKFLAKTPRPTSRIRAEITVLRSGANWKIAKVRLWQETK